MTKDTTTTIFYQAIGKTRHQVEIPRTRVEMIINKVDRYIDKGDLVSAKSILVPYIVTKRKKNSKKD